MMRQFSDREVQKLAKRFNTGKPFKHVVIERFLADHRALLRALSAESLTRKDTDLFSFSQTGNLFYSNNRVITDAVTLFSSKKFSDFISAISGIKLEPGAVDVSGALYENTDYLLCHDDRLEGRKIAFILYLSESFEVGDGGALVFLSSKGNHPAKKVIAYPPLQSSLMVFAVSEKSWHEVEEMLSDKKRYTIGGWLH